MFLPLQNPIPTSSARLSALQIGLGAALTMVLSLALPYMTAHPVPTPPITGAAQPGDERRVVLANELASKVRSLLDFTYGPGNSQVEVRVDLDENETVFSSTQYKGPERVTRETCLEESYGKQAIGKSEGQTVSSDDSVAGDESQQAKQDYRNVKRNRVGEYDRNDVTSTCRVPRIMAIHCAVALKVPHQEEQATRLVSGLLGLNQHPGDSLSLVCVPGKGILGL